MPATTAAQRRERGASGWGRSGRAAVGCAAAPKRRSARLRGGCGGTPAGSFTGPRLRGRHRQPPSSRGKGPRLDSLVAMRALVVVNPAATSTTAKMRDVLVGALASELKLDVVETAHRGHAAEL